MANNGHKNFNFNHNSNSNIRNTPHPPPQTTPTVLPTAQPIVPNGGIRNSGIPCVKSKIESKSAKFIWEINGISNIVKQKLWRIPNCEFSIGPCKWKLSLNLGDKENILYAKPELINPPDAKSSYSLHLSVVNAQNYVLHSPQFLPDHPLFYDGSVKHGSTWEVLRFSDGFVNLFSNYVSQDTLRILVEMIVYMDNGAQ